MSESPSTTERASGPGETAETIRVLCVEDDEDFAELTVQSLAREDERFALETASSAEAGLERLGPGVDCIVSDYNMPGMNGIEFLETVREPYPDLPFILFTGRGSEAVASEAISAGVTDYLQKESGLEQFAVLANRVTNAVEKRRTRAALERQNEGLDTVVSNVPLVVFALDPDGVFTLCRGQGLVDLSLDAGELVGESAFDVMAGREGVVDAVERALAGERTTETHHVGGTVFETTYKPVFDDEGAVASVIGVAVDVTERADRERDLEILGQALEKAHVPVVLTDPSRPDNPIVSVNERFEEATGYPESAATGRNCRFLQGEETDPDRVARIREGIDAEEETTVELRNYRADGTMFWNRLTVRPIFGEDGELLRFFGSQEDVTDRTESRQRLERQNERLDEFARVVSHDLRNPLQVARNRLTLATDECESDHLEAVADAHDRMDTLIDDLLALASAGVETAETRPVALATVTEACWDTVETGEATLTVETDLTLRADRNRLRQLLENLLRNAVEHGSMSSQTESDDAVEHGSTSSRTGSDDAVEHGGEAVHVTVGDLAERTGFYVADDGPGIRADDPEAVFESGYSTQGGGAGLGLAIVESVADDHDWAVTVTESADGGARFEVSGVDTPSG